MNHLLTLGTIEAPVSFRLGEFKTKRQCVTMYHNNTFLFVLSVKVPPFWGLVSVSIFASSWHKYTKRRAKINIPRIAITNMLVFP